ncbi:hypothetical protein [Ideonella oryzae]|uniref:DUF1488 family protein n=1 Tax=Ideonella oryzae TaxID=2937441 RepID=A0ABT1BI70_9BURK|nr:hypothetical protein [Ideonella oryzae]MCO5975619.1 hypothetical protein [Ideonella oryzae]
MSFDPGNGVMFTIEHDGAPVRCFVEQANEWLKQKEGSVKNFPELVLRYSKVIRAAAAKKAAQAAMPMDAWGHLITAEDLRSAQQGMRSE